MKPRRTATATFTVLGKWSGGFTSERPIPHITALPWDELTDMTQFRSFNHANRRARMGCVHRAHSVLFRPPWASEHPRSTQTSLRQCGEPVITRDALLLRSGLSFFAGDFEVDLAVMQLIRDGVIFPVADAPFTFAIDPSHPKGPRACAQSRSKRPLRVADARL